MKRIGFETVNLPKIRSQDLRYGPFYTVCQTDTQSGRIRPEAIQIFIQPAP